MIYPPAEDSYLLEEVVKDYLKDKNKSIKILDMGSGSGVQAINCKNLDFENVLAVDIDPNAIEYLEGKGLKTIMSDLFLEINKEKKFDLILFNPPYLPYDKREPKDSKLATTAGEEGYEIIVKFLEEAKQFLSDNAVILLLFSSLSKPKIILKSAVDFGYKYKKLKSLKLDFEELHVYEFVKC
jgi:release factor glutamine methyltransferase